MTTFTFENYSYSKKGEETKINRTSLEQYEKQCFYTTQFKFKFWLKQEQWYFVKLRLKQTKKKPT